ncbi:HAMP domain-containing sensor histidine kinase [Clostridium subterminale]|uniref:histidine kinase n=1 Tax=Clostridium subterminale TaxID=1550 RepID=A0ABN1KFS3_CLOSU
MVEELLIGIIIYMAIRFILLKKQLRKIEASLRNKERINITLRDKDTENLAEAINNILQDKKQLEITIRNREDRLKQSISDISHDLRTPLAAIRGYLTLLEGCNEEDKIEYINILKKKSEELNKLINNYYELSIWDNMSYEIDTKAIDIVEIVTDTVISNYTLIKENEIDFHNRLPDKKIEIQGEEITCGRIVQNLISNAIKYSTGYVVIEIDQFEKDIIFTIRNSVSDLKEADLKYLFDRFYTTDRSRNCSGTGLGLFIVKILLEKIGGCVNDVSLKDDILSISILFKSFSK